MIWQPLHIAIQHRVQSITGVQLFAVGLRDKCSNGSTGHRSDAMEALPRRSRIRALLNSSSDARARITLIPFLSAWAITVMAI
jgi:hypothetical protein